MASAVREAERLARSSKGRTFVVLEAVEAVRINEFERFDLRNAPAPAGTRDPDDDIPF